MIINCPFCNKKLEKFGHNKLFCACGKLYVQSADRASFMLNEIKSHVITGDIQFCGRGLTIYKNYSKIILAISFENDDRLIEILKNIDLYLALL